MTKSIETLVEDIQKLLDEGYDNLPEDAIERFGEATAKQMGSRLLREERKPGLRMSSIGHPCLRKLWLEYHYPDKLEKLTPDTRLKFLYGDITEEFILFLAELAGHTVEGRQDTQEIASILGHRDGVIDGVVVDVKSASTYSFNKFKAHLTASTDTFGYITQLQSYLHAGQSDPLVTDKSRGAFLVFDKTLGHLCLDFHDYEPKDWESEYEYRKGVVYSNTIPSRAFDPVPEGKSGNYKLGVNCSYCSVKHLCYDNLRTFLYYGGPTIFTKIVREPNVPEVLSTHESD